MTYFEFSQNVKIDRSKNIIGFSREPEKIKTGFMGESSSKIKTVLTNYVQKLQELGKKELFIPFVYFICLSLSFFVYIK